MPDLTTLRLFAAPILRRLAIPIAALAGVALALVSLAGTGGPAFLRSTGLAGTVPTGAGAATFDRLIDTLADNVVWICGTTIGLALAIVGLLFLAGRSRVADFAARLGVGVAVLIFAPGLAQ